MFAASNSMEKHKVVSSSRRKDLFLLYAFLKLTSLVFPPVAGTVGLVVSTFFLDPPLGSVVAGFLGVVAGLVAGFLSVPPVLGVVETLFPSSLSSSSH